MDLKVTKNNINEFNFLNFLHDKIIRKIYVKENNIYFDIWNSFDREKEPKFQIVVNLEKIHLT